MDPLTQRRIGRSKLSVTQLGFGGVPLGDPGGTLEESRAQATLAAVYEAGINFFDTSPWYGNTQSEHRIGHYLRSRPRGSYLLATKVGRVYVRPEDVDTFGNSPWMTRWQGGLMFDLRFDYTRDGIRRSYEDSLMRLGINTVDALAIHDLDFKHQKTVEGVQDAFRQLEDGGGFAVLQELKDLGEIRAIGAGVNHLGMIPRFLERFEMDYFLIAMPYTLLDQLALDQELPLCEEHGVGVVIGAVFASGILATGARTGAQYGYQPADEEVLTRVRRMAEVCERHDVPLAAAALQFPLGHPAVATVIPGADSPEQVHQNLDNMRRPIPADLWAELKHENLIRDDAPTPT